MVSQELSAEAVLASLAGGEVAVLNVGDTVERNGIWTSYVRDKSSITILKSDSKSKR